MFGLGMPEILLILAIALIVIGPKKLPDLAKTLGRAMGEFKRSAQDFKRSIDVETTVKDFKKDIDIPKVDLNEILTDPPSDEAAVTDQDETIVADKEDSGGLQNHDKKNIDENEDDDSSEDKNLNKADNTSEHDKTDKI